MGIAAGAAGAETVGRPSRIESIEAGRAFAAVIVVLYHINLFYFASDKFWPAKVFDGGFGFGHAGVEFFFVLSGLIITLVHAGDIGESGRVAPFAKRRIARIYPLYLICLVVMVARLLAAPSPGTAINAEAILASVLLIGRDPHVSLLLVGWTLFHEILFYGLFAFAIWRPRLGGMLMSGWFAAILLFGGGTEVAYPLRIENLLFGFGIAAGIALRRWTLPLPALLAVAGALLFGFSAAHELSSGVRGTSLQVIGYGLGATLLLVGLVTIERRDGMRVPALFVLVGEASYSIYLTHMLVLPPLVLAARLAGATRNVPAPLAFMGLALATIAVGVAVHLIIERRIVRQARRWLQPR